MFWRKKKSDHDDKISLVQAYAAQLGIERRRNIRIQYPKFSLPSLPAVFFSGHKMQVHDLSVGGLCLIDKDERMGNDTGNTVDLRLVWPDCERTVKCKLVSRVHDRRHIQFLDLAEERVDAIRKAIVPGASALTLKPVLHVPNQAVELAAKEVWTSLSGDSLVLSFDVHKEADIRLNGKEYRVMKGAWPLSSDGKPIPPVEFEGLLIFLVNIHRPSAGVSILTAQLQNLFFEGRG